MREIQFIPLVGTDPDGHRRRVVTLTRRSLGLRRADLVQGVRPGWCRVKALCVTNLGVFRAMVADPLHRVPLDADMLEPVVGRELVRPVLLEVHSRPVDFQTLPTFSVGVLKSVFFRWPEHDEAIRFDALECVFRHRTREGFAKLRLLESVEDVEAVQPGDFVVVSDMEYDRESFDVQYEEIPPIPTVHEENTRIPQIGHSGVFLPYYDRASGVWEARLTLVPSLDSSGASVYLRSKLLDPLFLRWLRSLGDTFIAEAFGSGQTCTLSPNDIWLLRAGNMSEALQAVCSRRLSYDLEQLRSVPAEWLDPEADLRLGQVHQLLSKLWDYVGLSPNTRGSLIYP